MSELYFLLGEGVTPPEPPPVPPELPPIPIVAGTRPNRWLIELCDANGVTLQWITRLVKGKAWSFKLNLPSSFTGTVPSNDSRIAGLHTDGYPFMHEGNRIIRCWRWENGTRVLRFSGKVWTVQDVGEDGDDKTTFVCFDPLHHLVTRLVRVEAGWGPASDATSKIEFDDMDGSYIARWIVAVTNQEKGHTGLEPGFKTFAKTVRDLGVSHYWRLNEGGSNPIHDIVGSVNLVPRGTGGSHAVAGALTGDRDTGFYIAAGDYADATPGSTGGDTFTIAGFIKPPAFSSDRLVFGSSQAIIVLHMDAKLGLYRSDGGSSPPLIVKSTGTLTANVWNFFVLTKAGATLHWYINGTEGTGTVTNLTMAAATGTVLFGGGSGFDAYRGEADEFMVWDGTAISAANVTALNAASQATALATYGNVFEASGNLRSVVYERRRVDQAVSELATSYGGFDLDIVPLNRTDGRIARMDILQQRGTDKPNAIFGYRTFPHNVKHIERDLNMEQVANDITGLASPLFGGPPLVSTYTDSASVTAYGVYEEVEVFADINDIGLLDALTTEEGEFRKRAREMVQWSAIPGSRTPALFTDFNLGDTIQLRVGANLRGGFSGMQRVYGVDMIVTEEGTEYLNSVTTTIP